MSKCSVLRTLKSKCSHCTLLRPKYCAFRDVEAKRRKRKATASLRIESTSPLKTLIQFAGRAAKLLPRPAGNPTPDGVPGCFEEVNGRDLSPNLFVEHLECMRPRAGDDAVDDPGHAHRLEVARGVDTAEIDDAPAERLADLRDHFLRVGIVAADEHVRRTAGQLRFEKERITDGVEGLHDARVRNRTLNLLAERVGMSDREARRAAAEVERIRGVDGHLVIEVG